MSYIDIVICIRSYPILETLATYIKGPGGDSVGQIESKPGSTSTFTFIATLFD
jgi:hypothetical protein